MSLFTWFNGLLGGLLVSSCCIIQLCLNLFGIGCAGLNTMLLPYRPIFISLTIISLSYAFWRSRPSKCHFTAVVIVTLLLSFSPEILRVYNNYVSNNNPLDSELISTGWKIEGMHCEACRAAVIKALKNLDGVHSVHVDLKLGEAVLLTRHAIDDTTVIRVVESAGFQAKKIA